MSLHMFLECRQSRSFGSGAEGGLSYQLSEGPIAHAALLERHDEILSEAMPRVVASVHGVKGSFVARSLR